MKIIVDSSVYIEFLRTGSGIYPTLIKSNSKIYTPSVVTLELYSGKSATVEEVKVAIKHMLRPTVNVDLTKQLAEKAGELVRTRQVDGLGDAVIAATSLYLNAQLATSNKKHFSKVKNLKFFEN